MLVYYHAVDSLTNTHAQPEKLLLIILDGVGHRAQTHGNAVHVAHTPALDYLQQHGLFTTLKAHGTWVGMPADDDLGNSEVGHTTLGAGRTFDQGAKLVDRAIDSGALFKGRNWRQAVKNTITNNTTLHFIGLLSDGNVHAHQRHLHVMLTQAQRDGVPRARVHAILDGRDVPAKSAEHYVAELQQHLHQLGDFDAQLASCGGRMQITMDRYEANWEIVQRGWELHVLGKGRVFASAAEGIATLRDERDTDDQFLPPFRIAGTHSTINDGDSVIFFNFRGDRATQVSQAFTAQEFNKFARTKHPAVFFAGMMAYDADRSLPPHYLVTPARIEPTLTSYLLPLKVRQFACSESQKYGHVTFFWNGNHSGYLDQKLEKYLCIPSHKNLNFDRQPWMKALEITEATIAAMEKASFDFARINFPNGDMVGHSGNFAAAVVAVNVIDLMLGRLINACHQHQVKLIVTADHGNCDEMYEQNAQGEQLPKTSHTLSAVPFYFYDPHATKTYQLTPTANPTLANVAATVLTAMNLPPNDDFHPSLLRRR